jgi:hypothetical protein
MHKILEYHFILHFNHIIIAKKGKYHGEFYEDLGEKLLPFLGTGRL